jgi:hypothetical protein
MKRKKTDGFKPVEIDCFRGWSFFDNIRFEILKVIFIDIDGIVLFDRVFDRLEETIVSLIVPSLERSYVTKRENRSSISVLFLCFLSKTRCLIRLEWINVSRPTSFNMIDASMFCFESNGVDLDDREKEQQQLVHLTEHIDLTQCSENSFAF